MKKLVMLSTFLVLTNASAASQNYSCEGNAVVRLRDSRPSTDEAVINRVMEITANLKQITRGSGSMTFDINETEFLGQFVGESMSISLSEMEGEEDDVTNSVFRGSIIKTGNSYNISTTSRTGALRGSINIVMSCTRDQG